MKRGKSTVRVCPVCGQGYDAFKSMERRARLCSLECLLAFRRARHSGRSLGGTVTAPSTSVDGALLRF